MTWAPPVSENSSLGKRAADAVRDIAAGLESHVRSPRLRPDLAYGLSGVSLFYHYLHRWTGDAKHKSLARKAMNIAKQNAHYGDPGSFLLGRSGFYWTELHTGDRPQRSTVAQSAFDMSVLRSFRFAGRKSCRFDVFDGIGGQAVYLAEINERSADYWKDFVEGLDRLAERDRRGIRWVTPSRPAESNLSGAESPERYDFGMAHGLGGMLAFLCVAASQGAKTKKTAELARGLVRWVSRFEKELINGAQNKEISENGRVVTLGNQVLAWCNGQPALALSLIRAGIIFEEKEWEKMGRRIALRSLKHFSSRARYRELCSRYYLLPGICHGTAGLMQMYARLYHYTNDRRFLLASRFWLRETLDWKTERGGTGGYGEYLKSRDMASMLGKLPREFARDKSLKWKPEPGFLTGASGIGLALLAGFTPVSPDWDRALLLS